MADIPTVGINTIQPIQVHTWMAPPPVINAVEVPVTVNLGTPIIQLPGCVQTHSQSTKSNTIAADDPNGVKTYCDANTPAFTPLDYVPEDLIYTKPSEIPTYKAPPSETPPSPEIPLTKPATATVTQQTESTEEPLPTRSIETTPVVETPVEVKPTIADYLPSVPQVTTTASIAVVATSAALIAKPCAEFVLKTIKPTVKKTMKKIASLRGQTPQVESLLMRRLAQRERNRAIRDLRRALRK